VDLVFLFLRQFGIDHLSKTCFCFGVAGGRGYDSVPWDLKFVADIIKEMIWAFWFNGSIFLECTMFRIMNLNIRRVSIFMILWYISICFLNNLEIYICFAANWSLIIINKKVCRYLIQWIRKESQDEPCFVNESFFTIFVNDLYRFLFQFSFDLLIFYFVNDLYRFLILYYFR
jgi:hypothetical protein